MDTPTTMLPEDVVCDWYAAFLKGPRDSLSEADKNLLLVYEVELIVENGSFHKLFLYYGHRTEEILTAMSAVGCDRIACLIREAMALLPAGVFISDDESRHENMWKIGKDAEQHLRRLTEDYYALCPDEPYEKMRQYIQATRA
jgi:hypothetical protein